MTDRDLALALTRASEIEAAARGHWTATERIEVDPTFAGERDHALTVIRHVTALRKSVESWIAQRAVRTAFRQSQ